MRSQDRLAFGVPAATAAGTSWRPLLSGPLRERALDTVDRLAGDLARWDVSATRDASLSTGSAGIAVGHAALARARGDGRAADLACARLDEAVEVLTTDPMAASLYVGFTGIAWAADVVDLLLDEEDEDRNEEIDHALAGWLRRYPGEEAGAPYDLIHGLTGLGTYALGRWPRPGAVDCLTLVVEQLVRRSRHDDDGSYWFTPPTLLFGPRRQTYPDGGVDLGVAHGMAAVLPLLARVRALGLAPEAVDPLLDGAVHWLQAHALPTPTGPALPAFVAPTAQPHPARTAWCYGSPGVSALLLLAALDAQRPEWCEFAVRLGLEAAARSPEATGVTDAGFCHGSAGVAHLFNRLHLLTGIAQFGDAARSWLERTVHLCTGTPSPGRPAWNSAGVLEGAAGVALALLAACTDEEPVWDRMFLVSTPSSPRPA